ncbi:hypothetical protein TP2_06115 [Thioclava pacifica DSM 10166]|uniref:Transporter n=2 Tax=Thioclava pacifica TaxID=285109 RepID=A0A074JA69_9RHOB|nr:hypothetical protein TP2_06115 [Thioclava pacifica DSM 10166]
MVLAGTVALSGCLADGTPFPTRNAVDPASAPLAAGIARKPGTDAQSSELIADLAARRSILPATGPYAEVAQAVLDHSAGAAQAELRVARLTAQAKSKNWLPQIGPSVSLSSLGDLVTQLVMEQVIFDNGAKKAERDFAAADVEVAAVELSQEMNDTVYDGLKFYISGLKAEAQAEVASANARQLSEFERILRERAKGGLSDLSEVGFVAQKRHEAEAEAQADRQAAQAARTQLATMSDQPMQHLTGLSNVALPVAAPEPLAVKRAEGEAARAEAEAQLAKAGHLPGLALRAGAGEGKPTLGVNMGMTQMLGFGRGDTLAAIEAGAEAGQARVAKARQDSARSLSALQVRLTDLRAREMRDAALVEEAESGLALFKRQYKMGRRRLMELVGNYESYAAMKRAQVGLRYEIALTELEIARVQGLLVDGSRI